CPALLGPPGYRACGRRTGPGAGYSPLSSPGTQHVYLTAVTCPSPGGGSWQHRGAEDGAGTVRRAVTSCTGNRSPCVLRREYGQFSGRSPVAKLQSWGECGYCPAQLY
ncbi:hypothetical protein GDO78_013725, partial [Eleutherodactylus coqui]